MPEHIKGTNMWNLLDNEFFVATDGEVVKGPLATLRIQEFPDLKLLSVQGPTRLWKVEGKEFDKVVQKN